MTLAITPQPSSASASPPNLAGMLTKPARVDAMFRNTPQGTYRSSASCVTSRPLDLALLTMCEVRTIPSPYRCGWVEL